MTKQNYINYKDKKIAYEQEGKGPTIVLLHGFCEDSRVWDEFTPDLIDNHRIVTIDFPGFGSSERIPNITIEQMADAVAAVVNHLELSEIILIGHSMGGYVSLAFAEKHPDLLIGLGLFHSHPFADSDEKKAGRQKGMDFINEHGHFLFVKQLFPNLFVPNYAKSNSFLIDKLTYNAANYQPGSIVDALAAMKNRPDRSVVLTKFPKPVLFIIGREDKAVPEEASIAQTHLPNLASIHMLEKVGHMGMFEARKQTQRIIKGFVQFCLEKASS